MITWQLPHGGFYKHDKSVYAAPWNGTAARSDWRGANNVELGTIDNDATVTEAMFLADVYRRSTEAKYRDAARKALDFLLTMQAPSGGFPQVYPARVGTTYSNYITFNDDAMVRVLAMLDYAKAKKAPLGGDVFTDDQLARISTAISKGIDFILKSQIAQAGVKTVWCAQHDPTSYEAAGARAHTSCRRRAARNPIGVIAFLMSQPQTPEIKAAAQAAIAWYKSDAVKVANTAYVSRPSGNTDDSYNPIQARAGSTMWYRFYDLAQDTGFFSGRLPTRKSAGHRQAVRHHGHRGRAPLRLPVGRQLRHRAVHVHQPRRLLARPIGRRRVRRRRSRARRRSRSCRCRRRRGEAGRRR